jgi:hypothetical protein
MKYIIQEPDIIVSTSLLLYICIYIYTYIKREIIPLIPFIT